MASPFVAAIENEKLSAPVEWHEVPYRDPARPTAAWSRYVPKSRDYSTDGCYSLKLRVTPVL